MFGILLSYAEWGSLGDPGGEEGADSGALPSRTDLMSSLFSSPEA